MLLTFKEADSGRAGQLARFQGVMNSDCNSQRRGPKADTDDIMNVVRGRSRE